MNTLVSLLIAAVVLYVLWRIYQGVVKTLQYPLQKMQRYRMPNTPTNAKLSKSVQHLERLMHLINASLKSATRMTAMQRQEAQTQIYEVRDNIVKLLWKMDHVQTLRDNVKDPAQQLELMGVQRKLQTELDRSLGVLEETSVALTKFDVFSGERSAARLLADLSETSKRLAHTGESYEDIQRAGRLSR